MTAPTEAPLDTAAESERKQARSSRIQVILVVVNLAFWAAILGWTVMSGKVEPKDHLDDPSFAAAAEPRCATAQAEIEDLGLPTAVETPQERAAMVIEENAILVAMVDDLDDLDRPAGEQGEWVTQWLADWRIHIQDRQDWADDLEDGDDHAFTESDRGGEQVSNVIDNFAKVNDMESCATAGDV